MTSLLLLKSMLFANALQKSKTKKKRKIVKEHKVKKPNRSMCRVCNQERGEIPIFDNMLAPNLHEEITNFSGVTIKQFDNLSKHICQSCLDLLNGCIMFREMCQRTNKSLMDISVKKEYVSTEYMKDLDNNDMKADHEENSFNIPSPSFSDENSEEIYPCSTCGTEFHDLKIYSYHVNKCRVRTPRVRKPPEDVKKKFLCDICGKVSCSNASLLVHMSIHENVFPYKCEQCPYQGRTMDLLKVHKRSHLAEKPFKCTQCPKATTTSSNLAKHMRHVHSTSRPYKCTYCDKAFSYQHDMKRHVRDIHLRQGTVECEVCFKKFNTKKILQGHRWKIHKIKGERQGRLPSYLQCQMEEQEQNENIGNDCDRTY